MKYIGVKNLIKRSGKVKTALLMLLLLIVIFAVLFYTGILGGGGFGFGPGGGDGVTDSDGGTDTSAEEEISNVITIRIDESSIYFGDQSCADVEELKQKIMETGNAKEYELIHDTAIKAVYDEVVEVLAELEKALEITVEYN